MLIYNVSVCEEKIHAQQTAEDLKCETLKDLPAWIQQIRNCLCCCSEMIKLEVDVGTKVGTINRQEVNTRAWKDGMKEKRPLGEETSL